MIHPLSMAAIGLLCIGIFMAFMQQDRQLCEGDISDHEYYSAQIYLDPGTIYAFGDDPDDKTYRVVPDDFPVHLPEKTYCDAIFFESVAEAEAAGYLPYR